MDTDKVVAVAVKELCKGNLKVNQFFNMLEAIEIGGNISMEVVKGKVQARFIGYDYRNQNHIEVSTF